MTNGPLPPPEPEPASAPEPAPASVLACCSTVYGSPLVELLVGDSLHPGGLESTRHLLEASKLRPGARLLDAGCGLGASSRLAAAEFGLVVDAVDASGNVLARLGARPTTERIRWREADLLALPYPAAVFDGALVECVLSTVPRAAALGELSRVLRPRGTLLLSDVVVAGDAIPALAEHRLLGAALCVTDAWRPGELEAQLRAAGFTIERRWDLTASILTLVDRVEARIGFATAAVRDLGLDLAVLAGGGSEDLDALRPEQAHRLADEIRSAVRRGELRYVAVVARAGDLHHGRSSVSERTASSAEPPQTLRQ